MLPITPPLIGWLRGQYRLSRMHSRRTQEELALKCTSYVSSFVTASPLTLLLVLHLLNSGDPDLVSTFCTLISPGESERGSWVKRRVTINIVDHKNCSKVKQSGSGTLELVAPGFLGLSLKCLVSRDFEYL